MGSPLTGLTVGTALALGTCVQGDRAWSPKHVAIEGTKVAPSTHMVGYRIAREWLWSPWAPALGVGLQGTHSAFIVSLSFTVVPVAEEGTKGVRSR